MSFLRVIVNPRDGESLYRVINKPPRGVGGKGTESFFSQASLAGGDYLSALSNAHSWPGITQRGAAALGELGASLRKAAGMVSSGDPAGEIIDLVLLETGLQKQYNPDDVADQSRLENIEELRRFAAQYDIGQPHGGLPGFLAEQSLLTTQDAYSEEGIALMTLHCAKGLEFDVVFIAGLEEGLLPHIRRNESAPSDLEEERRLLYVGMTRARKRLFLTSCLARMQQGGFRCGPSRFLNEIAPVLSESPAPRPVMPCPTQPEGYKRGEVIRHPRYGRGMVLSARRRGDEWELSIDFGFDEPKTILTGYVPLSKEGGGPEKAAKAW